MHLNERKIHAVIQRFQIKQKQGNFSGGANMFHWWGNERGWWEIFPQRCRLNFESRPQKLTPAESKSTFQLNQFYHFVSVIRIYREILGDVSPPMLSLLHRLAVFSYHSVKRQNVSCFCSNRIVLSCQKSNFLCKNNGQMVKIFRKS